MADQNEDDKHHEATPAKLEKAREKGDIPKYVDLSTAVAYLCLLIVAATIGDWSIEQFGSFSSTLIQEADSLTMSVLAKEGGSGTIIGLIVFPVTTLIPWFLGPLLGILAVLVTQRGVVFSAEKIKPKISKISVVKGFKNKFGVDGIVAFLKSALKLVIFSILLSFYIWRNLDTLIASARQDANLIAARIGHILVEFLAVATVIVGVIAVADSIWQYASHLRKNRMSDQELKDEHKEGEGDPHLKQSRRQRAQEIATSGMMAEVPAATVVVVNPTHFAVALKWSISDLSAPVCVAKGQDVVAHRIKSVARDAGVPIHSDPPTARALFATVELGEVVQPELYAPVAAAIRFAGAVKEKRK